MTVTSSRRRLGALVLCISVLAVVAAACGGSSGSSSSKVPSGDVAKVGSVEIKQAQFDDLIATAKASYKTSKKTFPAVGSAAYTTVRDQAMQELVQEAEISIGAKNLSISVTPTDVNKALDVIKKQYFTDTKTKKYDPAKYKAALKAQNTTDARVRDQLQQKLLADKITAKLTKGVTVPATAVAAYYAKNKSQFKVPATRHVRHILVKTKALADQLYAQLKTSDKSFAKLAKKYSTDKTSAVNGGDLKMIQKGQTVPTFDAVAFSEKAGVVSKPTKSTYGYHLIEALGPIKAASYRPLDATLKKSINTQLVGTAKQKKITTWLNGLKTSLAKEITYATAYKPVSTTTSTTSTTTSTG
ncbi:MAG TPA: peptidylprolyl isomerase [Gaiellales bacterium]|jgi:parvulin-like peptidyl-prolyl isomerase